MINYLTTKAFQKAWKKIFGKDISIEELNKQQSLMDVIPEAYGFKKDNLWNSIINGVNRLPRPILTFWAIYLLMLPLWNIDTFRDSVLAYAEMPAGLSAIIITIIGFWFGTKLATKTFVDSKKWHKQIQDAEEVKNKIKYTDDINDDSKPLSDETIAAWNENSKNKNL